MKILITGGEGMVGKHLQQYYPDAFYITKKICNLENAKETDELFKNYKPDVTIHLAAKVGGIVDNIKDPVGFYEKNILINTHTLQSAYKHGCKRFIGVLSTCAYPDVSERYPLTEEDLHKGPPAPTNYGYGYAKRCLAVQIDVYNKQHGTNYNYVIPCNLYSEYDNFINESKMHFVTALLNKIKKTNNNTLQLLGTGKPLRQFMYAGDLALVLKLMLENNVYDNFNICPDTVYSIDELAQIALQVTGKNYKIEYNNSTDGQFRKDVCNKRMLKHFPNFKFTTFSEGVKKVYNNFNE